MKTSTLIKAALIATVIVIGFNTEVRADDEAMYQNETFEFSDYSDSNTGVSSGYATSSSMSFASETQEPVAAVETLPEESSASLSSTAPLFNEELPEDFNSDVRKIVVAGSQNETADAQKPSAEIQLKFKKARKN